MQYRSDQIPSYLNYDGSKEYNAVALSFKTSSTMHKAIQRIRSLLDMTTYFTSYKDMEEVRNLNDKVRLLHWNKTGLCTIVIFMVKHSIINKNYRRRVNMKRSQIVKLLALTLALVLLVAGCAQSPAAPSTSTAPAATSAASGAAASSSGASVKGVKFGVSINSLDSPSNFAEFNFAQKYAKESGFEVVATNAEGAAAGQASDIETLVVQGCKVILIQNGDTDGLTNAIKNAITKGVKIISMETGWVEGISAMFEKGDFELGSQLYVRMAALMGFKGKIITTGHNDHPAIRVRSIMQDAVLKEYKGIERVNHVYTKYPGTEEVTYKGVETALLANPDVKAIWTTQDLEALGALQACKAAGKKDIIICSEGVDENVLSKIAEGSQIVLTAYYNLDWACKKAVEVAADLVNGKPIENWYQIPYDLVTKETAPKFLEQAKAINELFKNKK